LHFHLEGEENLTALGGMPLLLQASRSLGAGRSVAAHVHLKQRQRGLDEAGYIESFQQIGPGRFPLHQLYVGA
jgi:hypothetical protein